jgi:hypothetical protein
MAATDKNADLWRAGIVAYTIDGDVARLDLINAAISGYEANTNVRFVRRREHKDYVRFRLDAQSPFVSDSIGRGGGEQTISISSASVASYYHEIGHALGLIHEQQRSDRDRFIIVHWDNIPEDRHHDFEMVEDSANSATYDFRSIMHYSGLDAQNRLRIEAVGGAPLPEDIGRLAAPIAEDYAFLNQLYPNAGVIRRSSSERGAGGISEVAVVSWSTATAPDNALLVTAVRNMSNRLQLVQWDVDHLGGIRRMTDPNLDHGDATGLRLALVGNHVVGCMRNADGNLYLISWTRQLVKEADSGSMADKARGMQILPLAPDAFVTACIDDDGRLLLITWRIDGQGNFQRVGETGENGPKVRSISLAIAAGSPSRPIVTATVQMNSGRVRIYAYGINTSDLSIEPRGNSSDSMGDATMVSSARTPGGYLVVGCATDGDHDLLLIPFSVSRDGQTITRLSGKEAKAGRIRGLRMIERPYGVLTAICAGNRQLLLIKWMVAADGQITRLGDSGDEAGALTSSNQQAPLLDVLAIPIAGAAACTPVRNASGDLLLITWDDMNGPGELLR